MFVAYYNKKIYQSLVVYCTLRKVVAVFLSSWSSLEAVSGSSVIRQSIMDLLQSEVWIDEMLMLVLLNFIH